jgi:hypothetical protein
MWWQCEEMSLGRYIQDHVENSPFKLLEFTMHENICGFE